MIHLKFTYTYNLHILVIIKMSILNESTVPISNENIGELTNLLAAKLSIFNEFTTPISNENMTKLANLVAGIQNTEIINVFKITIQQITTIDDNILQCRSLGSLGTERETIINLGSHQRLPLSMMETKWLEHVGTEDAKTLCDIEFVIAKSIGEYHGQMASHDAFINCFQMLTDIRKDLLLKILSAYNV